jgi:hypothetical protein
MKPITRVRKELEKELESYKIQYANMKDNREANQDYVKHLSVLIPQLETKIINLKGRN